MLNQNWPSARVLVRGSFVILTMFSVQLHAFKVGLVLDKGGKDDKSFNSAAYQGSLRAQKELKIDVKTVEATDSNSLENLHRNLARRDFDLIIGIGFAQVDAIKKVSAQFPDKKFALVDGQVDNPNVRSLLFEEHEGSFLVGALAAMKSNQSRFGFIGGMDVPLIRRFELGYKAGVQHIRKNNQVISHYIGMTGEAWNNPAKAKELALAQYQSGVEIIFVAAGASGAGVFDAAEERKKLAIGVDSNQNWMKPGFILTSMLKRVDNAVFETIKSAHEGKFQAGAVRFGLANGGIDYSIDSHNQKLINAKMKKDLELIRKKIISKEISVPDYYKQKN